ncbi:MAG TPA: rhodanese-like domain-containing protein [Bacillota bacterium]|nr:rhodanese-like domain-containing protein [Bacillota bacterium]
MFGWFGANKKGWQNITPKEVEALIQAKRDIQIIDVRELAEYNEGHIKQAKWIPLGQLRTRHQEINNKETIVVCYSGGRSRKACDILASLGHTNLKNMVGGMMNWEGKITR